MKLFKALFCVGFIVIVGCANKPNSSKDAIVNTSDTSLLSTHKEIQADILADNNYANYFIVIIDTNLNYYTLNKLMFDCSRRLNITIDTLGRVYNKKKNLIALPEDSDDALYAGEYFPRRYPSVNLSLEYLNVYTTKASLKTIALVAGIYYDKFSADSLFSIVLPQYKKAFVKEAKMYIGCMH